MPPSLAKLPLSDNASSEESAPRETSEPTAKEYVASANALMARGDMVSTRAVLEEVMKSHHRNSLVMRALGELEYRVGNYAAAAKQWRRLLTKKKSNASARIYGRLAASLRKTGKLDEARDIISGGLLAHPDSREITLEKETIDHLILERDGTAAAEAPRVGAHPYKFRPDRNFWSRSVSDRNPLEIDTWYRKKFSLTGQAIACAGSCFAQHLGKRLKVSGFDYMDVEPAPGFLRPGSHADFGYGLYSARYGNIYTTRQLRQLMERARGSFKPGETAWAYKGGVVDPFRPTIEPEPFADEGELLAAQVDHLAAVVEMFEKLDVFVFTLGLTECWISREDGAAYPVAPGVSGGVFDPDKHRLLNLTYVDVRNDLLEFVRLVGAVNPRLKMLMTVSPVPLVATATDSNVVVATTYSKSVLRAVAGDIATENDWADYFPSFEIISSHVMRGQFFNPDLRTVSEFGVDHVMRQFFAEHKPIGTKQGKATPEVHQDIVCDEELIEAFGA